MFWKSLINPTGLNYWLIASGVGLNLIFTFMTLYLTFYGLIVEPQAIEGTQLVLMVMIFLSNLLTGWLIGWMADDNRGPSYGLISSLGSVGLIVAVVLPTGILGLLLAVVALAGGINGSVLSLRRKRS